MARRPEFPIVLVTRYAMNTSFAEGRFADPEWLAGRRPLFERYCLPFVRAQTDPRFIWVLAVDPTTPSTEIEWLNSVAPQAKALAGHGSAQLLRRLRTSLQAWAGTRCDTIMTVRLDSDDSIAPDFIERMRAAGQEALPAVRASRPRAFGFTHGCDHDTRTDQWAVRKEAYNQFLGLFVQVAAPATVLDTAHGRLFTLFDFIGIQTERPMWCTRVHGGNVGNDSRYSLRSPTAPVEHFVLGPRERAEGEAATAPVDPLADPAAPGPALEP